jgi:hypothetical protein
MPTPGIDAHIVIDGIGYILADTGDFAQESRVSADTEMLAPTFGDYQNALDPLSSDLTMLLPIGQGQFTDGIGGTDLELSPKGYERGENLMVTPQGTLLNGPQIVAETFTSTALPLGSGPSEGYLGGVISNSAPLNYFGLGTKLFYNAAGAYSALPDTAAAIKHIGGYAGKVVISLGDTPLLVYTGNTQSSGTFYAYRFFTLNGMPFIIYRDGRIYAAYIDQPEIPSNFAVNEAGAIAAIRNWAYIFQYVISPDLVTEASPLFAVTKLANQQMRLALPVKGYRGGEIKRRIWRTKDNNLSAFYLLADDPVLGSLLTSYVDATDDGALSAVTFDFSTLNTTAVTLLTRGSINENMAFADTEQLFMPEVAGTPSTGSLVNCTEVFHDAQGNEALLIGCTNGLFLWNGSSRTFQTLKLVSYNNQNFKYMAVNHGVLYYTLFGKEVRTWNINEETIIQGPWLTQFNSINDIRLHGAGKYIFIGVSGINKYDNTSCFIIYAWDGRIFTWSYRLNTTPEMSNSAIYPVMGSFVGRNDFIWFPALMGDNSLYSITLNPVYTPVQETEVKFRSGSTDLDLPRLRKQIHAVMLRYLRLTPQVETTLTAQANIGDTTITVASIIPFNVGDWICIKEQSLDLCEYRKITAGAGNTLTLGHTLGAELLFDHAPGIRIVRCGTVATLRNVFTDTLNNQDIEVGGPCDANDLFSLIRLPKPVYAFTTGLNIDWLTVMELQGWAMLTALNPPYNGLIDVNIRLQDKVKLPNGTFDNATARERMNDLKNAYNKGTVTVIDPLNNNRQMRFQRLSFNFEEPKERHLQGQKAQATAHVRLIDVQAELMKQETLTLQGLSGNLAQAFQ